MKSFYESRELAQKLNLPLARFKRWAREFLPPDRLGGLQSGYARKHNLNEAFKVYLGGFLVHEAKLSVDQSRTILKRIEAHLPSLFRTTDISVNEKLVLEIAENMHGRAFCRLRQSENVIYQDSNFQENTHELLRVAFVGRLILKFVKSLGS